MSYHAGGNEVIPSARRLIKSLRDMGYDFASAVADLVDNSIEAGATLVAIDIEFDGDDSWIRIADNGRGMTPSQLREAMRYGAEREYEREDLGKFGLGLKTASLSQCQRLSVASRTNPGRADIAAYCWDMAHIEKTNRWEILPLERNGLGPAIREPLKETTGTVVLWQRLDRILGYRHPYGETARKRLSSLCRDVEDHLAMVFHRFLSGEIPKKKFRILLNGNAVRPWDPFARGEKKTKVLTPVMLKLEYEGVSGEVKLEPYVLPHQNDFCSPEAFKQASGPANWNQQQGFYIYRAGRLIQSGGWCRLRTIDEHTKLARIALSFSPALDEAFKINVAKMRVQLPLQIREQTEQAIKPVVKIARDTYDRSSSVTSVTTATEPASIVNSTNVNSGRITEIKPSSLVRGDSSPSETQKLWTIDELHSHLKEVAEPEEKPIISRVFNRFLIRLKSKGDS
ncbi:MAG: ATP-binding protein [Candidatus Jettenia caeni]|nr:MAG: ATP-binding protein [Candidatus Jettenia caeni]